VTPARLPLRQFFGTRWNGHTSARKLFWWDMAVVGSLLNSFFGVLALILLARDAGEGVWLLLHLALIPYNLFLVISVHRHTGSRFLHRSAAITWLGCTLLI